MVGSSKIIKNGIHDDRNWHGLHEIQVICKSLFYFLLNFLILRKWRLDFEEFLDFLNMICQGKEIKVDDIKKALLEAGPPGGGTEIVVVK